MMPFKSRAQRRKFHAKAARGEISHATVKRWEEHTPKGRSLPERVSGSTKRRRRLKRRRKRSHSNKKHKSRA